MFRLVQERMEAPSHFFKDDKNRQQTGARRVNFDFAAEMEEASRRRKDIFPDTQAWNGVEQGVATAISTVK